MARRIAMAMVLVAGGCSSSDADVKGAEPAAEHLGVNATTTPPSTVPPTTTTTVLPVEASIGRTSTSEVRPTSTTTAPPPPSLPVAGGAVDEAFWRRLADCECASGHCGGGHIGWFQFSPDTAAKVSIDGSEGYEEQRAAAIEWARRIHPRENTRSGWPHCWDEAA